MIEYFLSFQFQIPTFFKIMKISFYYFLQIKWKNHNKQQKCYHESLKMSNFYFHFYVKSSESMTFSAAKFWEREKTCTQEKKLRKNISITCLEEWVRKKICVINDSSSDSRLGEQKKNMGIGKTILFVWHTITISTEHNDA